MANADVLAACKRRLAAAVQAHPRFEQLAGGLEVRRRSGPHSLALCPASAAAALVATAGGSLKACCVEPNNLLTQLAPSCLHCSTAAAQPLQVHGRTKTLFSTLKKLLRLGNTAAGGRARTQVRCSGLHAECKGWLVCSSCGIPVLLPPATASAITCWAAPQPCCVRGASRAAVRFDGSASHRGASRRPSRGEQLQHWAQATGRMMLRRLHCARQNRQTPACRSCRTVRLLLSRYIEVPACLHSV